MISSIYMKDCQAIAEVTLNLATDRINVLFAHNNTGKSIFFKMLKAVASPKFYNAKRRKKLIRWGCDCAIIAFEFTSGAVGVVWVYPQFILYGFKEPDQDDFDRAYEPQQKFLDECGLLVNADGDFIANIIDTDQNLMLVNLDEKKNYDFVSFIACHPGIENARANVEESLTVWRNNLAELSIQEGTLEREISKLEFVDADVLEREIQVDELVYNVLYNLLDVVQSFSELQLPDTAVDFEQLLRFLEIEENLSKCSLDRINWCDNVLVEEELKLLELLDTIEQQWSSISWVDEIGIEQEYKCYEITEKLNTIWSAVNICNDIDISTDEIDLLSRLENCVVSSTSISVQLMKLAETGSRIAEMETAIEQSGEIVQCPVLGKVVYNGKGCLSIDF